MKKCALVSSLCCMILITFCSYSFCDPIQWKIEDGGNGNWYDVIVDNSTWTEANDAANSMGNGWHLATVTSQTENLFVIDLFKGNQDLMVPAGYGAAGYMVMGPWLGSYMENGVRRWVTDELFSFTAWGPYEPFHGDAYIHYVNWTDRVEIAWNDIPNDWEPQVPGYIIESANYSAPQNSPVPEPTTILLFGSGLIGLAGFRKRFNN